MAISVKQLRVNITETNTWTQLTDASTGSVYAVPASSRADIKLLTAENLGANDADVSFAISADSTITDVEREWPDPTLATGEFAIDDSVRLIPASQALWARATGTTPNVTFKATVLEIT
jgi:hypothetical protein